jgi:hypothetical protein
MDNGDEWPDMLELQLDVWGESWMSGLCWMAEAIENLAPAQS